MPLVDDVLRLLDPAPERPKDIHALRVGIRRLRVGLDIFRKSVGKPRRSRIDAELAWVMGKLGPVREWDVLAADLEDAPSTARHERTRALLRVAMAERRKKSLHELQDALAGDRALRLRRALVGVRRLVTDADLPEGAEADRERVRRRSRAALEKRVRKFGEHMEAANGGDAEALHDLRLQAKKLRYTIELVKRACPDVRVERPLETLVDLQDRLGAEQDAVVERERLAALSRSIGTPPLKMPRRRTRAAPPTDPHVIAGACQKALRQLKSVRIATQSQPQPQMVTQPTAPSRRRGG